MDQTWKIDIQPGLHAGTMVLAVSGRLGTDGAGRLLEAIVQALGEGHRRIVVDLQGVDYVSSAGLMALDAAAGRVQADAGTLLLCGLREPVRLVFELAGLLPEFGIASDRAEALDRLKS